jgi:hypothetical protein
MDKHNNDTNHGQSREQPGPPERKRRRGRLPVRAKLVLDDSLSANEHHPLARSAPEVRAASRLRLIATVLARMARSALARKS